MAMSTVMLNSLKVSDQPVDQKYLRTTLRRMISYKNISLQEACVTLGLERVAVLLAGEGRCVTILVRQEPTERTAPALVCVRTRETVTQSLGSATAPWDGR